MGRLFRNQGEGAYIRVQNHSSFRVDFKVIEKNHVDDMGNDDIQGPMTPGSKLPNKGKHPFEDENGNADEDATYCYIEGDVQNRLQRDGSLVFYAQDVAANNKDKPNCPSSTVKLIVDHNSWKICDGEQQGHKNSSRVVLAADIQKEDGMWKIELRIYNKYDTKCWMGQMADAIKDLPLTQVGLPGTHDSGTYCFDKDKGASPDNDLTSTIQRNLPGRVLGAVSGTILSQVFGRLCQCQDKSITEQLHSGIRYFDLRIVRHEETGEFYTCHGVFCAKMKDVMIQFHDFLSANPKEIVILDFNHLYEMDSHHQEFLKSVFDLLGKKAANLDVQGGLSQDSKVMEYWKNGFQAIVFYQKHDIVKDRFGGKVWPPWRIRSPWPESGDTDDLYNKLDAIIKTRSSEHLDKLFVLQGILTPDVDLIKNGLMDGDGLSIKAYARRCSPKIVDWCEDEWMKSKQRRLNIVIVDFYDGCSIIPALLNYNRRTD